MEEELDHLRNSVEPELNRLKTELDELENRRLVSLCKLRKARATIEELRSEYVNELNSSLSDSIAIDLSERDTSLYVGTICNMLPGARIYDRENQVSLVCNAYTPEELVEIVRTSSVQKLMNVGVAEGNAERMIQKLSDESLFEIERIDVPCLPQISLKREGESEYTNLNLLSVGEKCSAILTIALLRKDKPLIIDQPEDDLDYVFIIESIVEGIRQAKQDRQIIVATHNPNIPVLGDAEMVFRVARQPEENICKIMVSGGLERPAITREVQALEGGAEAFERRRKRYAGVA